MTSFVAPVAKSNYKNISANLISHLWGFTDKHSGCFSIVMFEEKAFAHIEYGNGSHYLIIPISLSQDEMFCSLTLPLVSPSPVRWSASGVSSTKAIQFAKNDSDPLLMHGEVNTGARYRNGHVSLMDIKRANNQH